MPNNTPEKTRAKLLIKQSIDLVIGARHIAVRQTDSLMVVTYFHLGYLIVENEQGGKLKADYGKKSLALLSKALTKEFGKGFSVDNLENMRAFYTTYKDKKGKFSISETASRKSTAKGKKQLTPIITSSIAISETLSRISYAGIFTVSWSHYVFLCRIKDEAERSFYEIETKQCNWGIRELKRQFDSGLYERLLLSKDKKKIRALSKKGQIIEKPEDVMKSPCILEFLGLDEKNSYTETELEKSIVNKIEQFLLEMGKGFLFQGRQVRFSFDEEHFFVDLVLYNRLLQCFVLIDLKIGQLKHQDIGQMQMYVNYYDRFVKKSFEKPTVGIILCKDKSNAVVEITLPENNKTIFAKEYSLYLPSKIALKKLIE